jgi:hypothetical protein
MYEPQRSGLPTWAKILIGIVVAIGALIVVAAVIGVIFMSRFVRIIQSDSSGSGGAFFSSTLRWQHGVLVADVSEISIDRESARIVKITSVTLNGVSSDHFVPNAKRSGTLSFPFDKYRGVGGDQEQIRINYETPSTGESGYQSTSIDVPTKPTDPPKK